MRILTFHSLQGVSETSRSWNITELESVCEKIDLCNCLYAYMHVCARACVYVHKWDNLVVVSQNLALTRIHT